MPISPPSAATAADPNRIDALIASNTANFVFIILPILSQHWLAVVAALAAVSLLASGCAPSSASPPVSLPIPQTGEVTFYLSLPTTSTTGLSAAATKVATAGSPDYRHFSSLDQAARQFGATHSVNSTAADAIEQVRAVTGGGAHYAFECVGHPDGLATAYAVTRRGVPPVAGTT